VILVRAGVAADRINVIVGHGVAKDDDTGRSEGANGSFWPGF
jgi:hypothetical protein